MKDGADLQPLERATKENNRWLGRTPEQNREQDCDSDRENRQPGVRGEYGADDRDQENNQQPARRPPFCLGLGRLARGRQRDGMNG
jgi:hypothetical protein